jgi:hypothetical protein
MSIGFSNKIFEQDFSIGLSLGQHPIGLILQQILFKNLVENLIGPPIGLVSYRIDPTTNPVQKSC